MRSDGPSTRVVLHILVVIASFLAVLWLLWVSRGVITWLAIGAFLAVAINPLVTILHRRLRLRRAGAILVVYLVLTAVMAGAALLFVPPLIDAGEQATEDVPVYVDRLAESSLVQELDAEYGVLQRLEAEATAALEGIAGPDTAFELATRVTNGLLALVSIAVICFLLSLYGPRLRIWALGLVEGEPHQRLERICDRIYRVISGYVLGILLVATTGGFAAWIFLAALGVPFALLLAFWAGLASLIPLVGATIGGVPYIVVAFFQSWQAGVAAIAFLLIYQQVENNVFQPVIHRFTVQLNPLWIILAVLVGANILGVLGALIAIPVAGIAQVLIQEWWSTRRPARRPDAALVPIDGASPGP